MSTLKRKWEILLSVIRDSWEEETAKSNSSISIPCNSSFPPRTVSISCLLHCVHFVLVEAISLRLNHSTWRESKDVITTTRFCFCDDKTGAHKEAHECQRVFYQQQQNVNMTNKQLIHPSWFLTSSSHVRLCRNSVCSDEWIEMNEDAMT